MCFADEAFDFLDSVEVNSNDKLTGTIWGIR